MEEPVFVETKIIFVYYAININALKTEYKLCMKYVWPVREERSSCFNYRFWQLCILLKTSIFK